MYVSYSDYFPFCTNKYIEIPNYSSFHNTKELLNVSLVLCQKTPQEFLMWLSIGNCTDRKPGFQASTVSPVQHTNVRDPSYAASMKMCVMATPCYSISPAKRYWLRAKITACSLMRRDMRREAIMNTKHTHINLYKCNASAFDLLI